MSAVLGSLVGLLIAAAVGLGFADLFELVPNPGAAGVWAVVCGLAAVGVHEFDLVRRRRRIERRRRARAGYLNRGRRS